MAKVPFSMREGLNPNAAGFDIHEMNDLFIRLYNGLVADGLTHEYLGFSCTDDPYVPGSLRDVEFTILMTLRKKDLWPPQEAAILYTEDDLFDIIEFLFDHVSAGIDGWEHKHDNCGTHWTKFDKVEGQKQYRYRINQFLSHYEKGFELSAEGMVLRKGPEGLSEIFEAQVPSKDGTILAMVAAATNAYRRHGSSVNDRRHAVNDLAHVLETLRPRMREVITKADEGDLFNIANNFGIRHQNDKQKTDYEQSVWLSWMFYHYLATIHLILRRLGPDAAKS